MNWLSRIFGGQLAPSRPASAGTLDHAQIAAPEAGLEFEAAGFGTWRDPSVGPLQSDWEKRLYAFARKCSGRLTTDGVPLFRCAWPRNGSGTYLDAFWLVAFDVRRANRCWNKNVLNNSAKTDRGHPPLAARNEFDGQFSGRALLLTRSGVLCTADGWGFFGGSDGEVDNRTMDIVFTDVGVDSVQMQSYDWGWGNAGRWRRHPQDDIKLYDLQLTVESMRFDYRYRPGADSHTDGKGTSMALKAYVESAGAIRWPRNFLSFYDD